MIVFLSAATCLACAGSSGGTGEVIVVIVGDGTVAIGPGPFTCWGSVCESAPAPGASATISAQPNPGGGFLGWTGACTGTSANCTVVVSARTVVTASFTTVAHVPDAGTADAGTADSGTADAGTADAGTADAGTCARDTDCSSWQTCNATHICVSQTGYCSGDGECASYEHCDDTHSCSPLSGRCNTDQDCSGLVFSCDPTHTCAYPVGGGDVLLYDGLTDSPLRPPFTCSGNYAISRVNAPQAPQVGFVNEAGEFNTDSSRLLLRPNGDIWYIWGVSRDELRLFVPDPWTREELTGFSIYPTDPFANDPVLIHAELATCPTLTFYGVSWLVQGGNGQGVLWSCLHPEANDYFDAASVKRFSLSPSQEVLSWNQDDYKLLVDRSSVAANYMYVMAPGGTLTQITGAAVASLATQNAVAIRSHPGGFWVMYEPAAGGEAQLGNIDNQGNATILGVFASSPDDSARQTGAVLDSAGVLYTVEFLPNAIRTDRVVRRPLQPAAASISWTTENPLLSDCSVFPPRVYNSAFAAGFEALVTGR